VVLALSLPVVLTLTASPARAGEPAAASPWEFRALAGAGLDANPHGEVDLGLRRGAWSAELFTDTLDLRWQPTLPRGRAWLGLRGQGFAGAMLITPYELPATRALSLASVAVDGGAMGWLPAGFYAGGGGRASVLSFGPRPDTQVPIPGAHLVAGPFAGLGWWTQVAQAELRVGTDFVAPVTPPSAADAVALEAAFGPQGAVGGPLEPWAEFEARWRSRAFVAPRMELRAGASSGKGAATTFRAGGSMPYQVPLVGYGWSSQWLTAYAAARAGVFVGSADAAPGSGVGAESVAAPSSAVRGRVGVVADALVGNKLPNEAGAVELGAGLAAGVRWRRAWLVGEGGCAFLEGTPPGSCAGMVRLGVDWLPVRGARP
jgi:hypothetical protein